MERDVGVRPSPSPIVSSGGGSQPPVRAQREWYGPLPPCGWCPSVFTPIGKWPFVFSGTPSVSKAEESGGKSSGKFVKTDGYAMRPMGPSNRWLSPLAIDRAAVARRQQVHTAALHWRAFRPRISWPAVVGARTALTARRSALASTSRTSSSRCIWSPPPTISLTHRASLSSALRDREQQP